MTAAARFRKLPARSWDLRRTELSAWLLVTLQCIACDVRTDQIYLLPQEPPGPDASDGGQPSGQDRKEGGTSPAVDAAGTPVPFGPCAASTNCAPPTPVCDLEVGTCVECVTSAECDLGNVCAHELRTCVPRCRSDADCVGSGRPTCAISSGVCVECTNDTGCSGSTPFCNMDYGTCQQCREDTDCLSRSCDNGFCKFEEDDEES